MIMVGVVGRAPHPLPWVQEGASFISWPVPAEKCKEKTEVRDEVQGPMEPVAVSRWKKNDCTAPADLRGRRAGLWKWSHMHPRSHLPSLTVCNLDQTGWFSALQEKIIYVIRVPEKQIIHSHRHTRHLYKYAPTHICTYLWNHIYFT